MVDAADVPGRPPLAWPVIGNYPGERGIPFSLEQDGQVLKVKQHQPRHPYTDRDLTARARHSGGALDDHVREPLGPGATNQGRAVPGMGPQPPGGRPGAHSVQPAVRRARVFEPPARRPGPGQAREGHGLPRFGSRSGRVPDLAARFHRPRPQPLGAPGARNARVLGGPRHPRTHDLRPHCEPAHRHDATRARVVEPSSADGFRQGQARVDRPDRASPRRLDCGICPGAVGAKRVPPDRAWRDPAGDAATLL